jgi:hypothetical protein
VEGEKNDPGFTGVMGEWNSRFVGGWGGIIPMNDLSA